jgi:hypothetical protein
MPRQQRTTAKVPGERTSGVVLLGPVPQRLRDRRHGSELQTEALPGARDMDEPDSLQGITSAFRQDIISAFRDD